MEEKVFKMEGFQSWWLSWSDPGPTWKPNPDHSKITTKTKNLSDFSFQPTLLQEGWRVKGFKVWVGGLGRGCLKIDHQQTGGNPPQKSPPQKQRII